MTFRTLDDVIDANRRIGNKWFDPSNMRFFNTRLSHTLYGGRYFITSEQNNMTDPPQQRLYSVREALPDGRIKTVGEFQAYATRSQALHAIQRLLREASEP
jgi:hypothetical protein